MLALLSLVLERLIAVKLDCRQSPPPPPAPPTYRIPLIPFASHNMQLDLQLLKSASSPHKRRRGKRLASVTVVSEFVHVKLVAARFQRRVVYYSCKSEMFIDRPEERGAERGNASTGRERAIVSRRNIGTVLKATLGKLLRDRGSAYGLFQAHRYHLELN